MSDTLSLIKDTMASILTALSSIKLRWSGGLPSDATFATEKNGTLITSTAKQDIITAPAAGKAIFLLAIDVSNPTGAETPIITIEDDAATPVVQCIVAPGASNAKRVEFAPPLQLTTAKKMTGKADSSVGDVTVVAHYAVGTPA